MSDKLPTANDLINENLAGLELTMDADMWHFYKDVIRQCIESHTAAHTAGLREEIDSLHEDLSGERILLEAARKQLSVYEERVKELEALMQEFVDRVDRGEVRSKKTYAKFKEALK